MYYVVEIQDYGAGEGAGPGVAQVRGAVPGRRRPGRCKRVILSCAGRGNAR